MVRYCDNVLEAQSCLQGVDKDDKIIASRNFLFDRGAQVIEAHQAGMRERIYMADVRVLDLNPLGNKNIDHGIFGKKRTDVVVRIHAARAYNKNLTRVPAAIEGFEILEVDCSIGIVGGQQAQNQFSMLSGKLRSFHKNLRFAAEMAGLCNIADKNPGVLLCPLGYFSPGVWNKLIETGIVEPDALFELHAFPGFFESVAWETNDKVPSNRYIRCLQQPNASRHFVERFAFVDILENFLVGRFDAQRHSPAAGLLHQCSKFPIQTVGANPIIGEPSHAEVGANQRFANFFRMVEVQREVIVDKLEIPEDIFPAGETQFLHHPFRRSLAKALSIDFRHAAKGTSIGAAAAVNHWVRKERTIYLVPGTVCGVGKGIHVVDEVDTVGDPAPAGAKNETRDGLRFFAVDQIRQCALSLSGESEFIEVLSCHIRGA
jgi:hypothetical protein